jgi:hypothetical protein
LVITLFISLFLSKWFETCVANNNHYLVLRLNISLVWSWFNFFCVCATE